MARQPKSSTEPKKGTASWKPATALTLKKIPGHRVRWLDKDPKNLQRKLAEGWVLLNAENGVTTEHEHPGDISSGKPLTSVTEYRELIGAALPEDVAQARDAYFAGKTDQQSAALKKNLQRDLADGGAEVHGKITIIE